PAPAAPQHARRNEPLPTLGAGTVPLPSAAAGVKTQAVAQTTNTGSGKKVFQDPVAREALSLVGMDVNAELYWFAALDDPALPKSERQDLIDDLNEEGLADPKHPTVDDLPLLLARIEILGEAMECFGSEAYDWKEP